MTEVVDHSAVVAPRHRKSSTPRRIGEMLVERELISAHDLEAALELQRQTGRRLGETLVALGLVSSADVLLVLVERLGLDDIVLADTSIDSMVAQSVPELVARRYRALPISRHDDVVTVAMHDPSDVFAVDDLAMLLDAVIMPVLADPEQIDAAINRMWTGSNVESTLLEAPGELHEVDDVSDILATAEEAPIIRMVNAILAQAVAERVSDVHFEPTPTRLRVRLRVDGVLHDTSDAPLSADRPIVSRLKIMAGIDIARTRLPQDGRFSVSINERQVDVRMATLPTAFGEAAILRLLDKVSGVIELDELGFTTDELERYRSLFNASQGVIMTSGPTGSGKTSTLYATLLEIDSFSQNIIAVEDPIEYRVEGIKQMQVETRSGLSFPLALRSILRIRPGRDPDRRDPRPRDGPHRRRSVAHRPPRLLHHPHHERGRRPASAHRHGSRAVPRDVGADRGRRPAPGAPPLRVRRASRRRRGNAGPVRPARGAARLGRHPAAGRVRGVHRHRVLRPDRDLRDHGHDAGHLPDDQRPRRPPRYRALGGLGRHGHAAHGSPPAGRRRRAQHRRAPPR